MPTHKTLLVFESTYAVISAERILMDNHLQCEIIPVPRTISADCGMAIVVEKKEIDMAVKALKAQNIGLKNILHDVEIEL